VAPVVGLGYSLPWALSEMKLGWWQTLAMQAFAVGLAVNTSWNFVMCALIPVGMRGHVPWTPLDRHEGASVMPA